MKTDILSVTQKLREAAEFIKPKLHNGGFYFEFPRNVFWSIASWNRGGKEEYTLYLYSLHEDSLNDLIERSDFLRRDDGDYHAYSSETNPRLAENIQAIYEVLYENHYGVGKIFEKIVKMESFQDESRFIAQKQQQEEANQKRSDDDPPF